MRSLRSFRLNETRKAARLCRCARQYSTCLIFFARTSAASAIAAAALVWAVSAPPTPSVFQQWKSRFFFAFFRGKISFHFVSFRFLLVHPFAFVAVCDFEFHMPRESECVGLQLRATDYIVRSAARYVVRIRVHSWCSRNGHLNCWRHRLRVDVVIVV